MKYLFGLFTIALIVLSFTNRKCEHVFTEVVQPEIKIEHSSNLINVVFTIAPVGKHEGNEIVCVKCFHKQKQILDYGSYRSYCIPELWWGRLSDSIPEAQKMAMFDSLCREIK